MARPYDVTVTDPRDPVDTTTHSYQSPKDALQVARRYDRKTNVVSKTAKGHNLRSIQGDERDVRVNPSPAVRKAGFAFRKD